MDLTPATALPKLLAAAWLGEAVTLSQLLGGVLILAGVWLLSRPADEVAVSDIHE